MPVAARPVGTVAWVDLSTPDVDGAAAFYAGLLGWTVSSDETPMGRYVIGSIPAGPVAGLLAPSPEDAAQPPAWTVVLRVESASEAFDRAQRLGATGLQPPMEIPGGARIAVVADPAAATVALMETRDDPPLAWGDAGAVVWVETHSRDVGASGCFYAELLGWEQEPEIDGYRVFRHDSGQVAGLMAVPAAVPDHVPSYWLVYFAVSDLAQSVERVGQLGGTVVVPTKEVADMRFAVAEDPFGATFALLEIAR
jgi:uncharacterized protein